MRTGGFDRMDFVERKLKVIEAATQWAEVLRGDATFSERVRARDAFSAALDEALADHQGAVDTIRDLIDAGQYATRPEAEYEERARWRHAVARARALIGGPSGAAFPRQDQDR